jgi:acyl dehydratase
MRVFTSLAELADAVGEELGPSGWLTIDQARIDMFADATGDHQWIHVDVERAAKGPFGATVAHGYLTLALVPILASQIFHVGNLGAAVNYGINKVRFPSPVKVNSRVRARATILELTDVPAGKQMLTKYVLEIEGQDKPACVAETVVRLLE